MLKTLKSELKQRELFLSLFKSDEERLYCEVPVFCRSVDVVKYNCKTGTVTAIEFKLNDWKRAIGQALSVSICFDYLEICVPKPKMENTQNNIITKCEQTGIGLYFFDESQRAFNKIVEPLEVKEVWEMQRSSVVNYVGGMKK